MGSVRFVFTPIRYTPHAFYIFNKGIYYSPRGEHFVKSTLYNIVRSKNFGLEFFFYPTLLVHFYLKTISQFHSLLTAVVEISLIYFIITLVYIVFRVFFSYFKTYLYTMHIDFGAQAYTSPCLNAN